MTTITKASGADLTLGTNWSGGITPGVNDVAQWASTSSSGNHTGSLSIQELKINGALGDIAHTGTGTLTISSTNDSLETSPGVSSTVLAAFKNDIVNNRRWTQNGGTINIGSANTYFILYHSGTGLAMNFAAVGGLIGTGILSIANASPTANRNYAQLGIQNNHAGFTGTLRLTNRTALTCGTSSSTIGLTAANIIIDGAECAIYPGVNNAYLGTSARTLTINNDLILGASGLTIYIQNAIDLGSSLKSLTIDGPTILTGGLTGTSGFTKAGAGNLTINATTARAISGQLNVNGGNLLLGPTGYAATGNNVLANITAIYVGAASLQYQCLDTYAEDATLTSISGSQIYSMANAASFTGDISGYNGQFILHTTSSGTLNKSLSFSNLPTSAQHLEYRMTATSPAVSDQTFTFNHTSSGTCPAQIRLGYSANGTLGGYLVNNAASGVSTTFSGEVKKIYYSAIGTKTVTFGIGGTNDSSILSGIISEGGTAGALSLIKYGTGKWTLSGTNTYTGLTTLSAGTLSLQNSSALGSDLAGDVTQSAGTIEISNNITLNKGTRTLTLASISGANSIQVPVGGGDNTIICGGVPLGTSATVNFDIAQGASLTFQNSGAMSGGTNGINKKSGGELNLGSTVNSFTGIVTVSDGTLTAGNIHNSGTNSSLGSGNTVSLNGTLKYVGTSPASTNRTISLNGPSIALDSSGTGHIVYRTISHGSSLAKTLTLKGTNTGSNHISSSLGDASQPTSLRKEGIGRWIFVNGTVNYTGLTTITEGTLDYGDIARTLTGNISMSGGTLENGTSTIESNVTMTGGRVTARISGAKNIAVNSNTATLYPASASNNEYSGTTTISAGSTVNLFTDATPSVAGTGRVLGTSDVTVNGDIVTGYSLLQKGQMRYGGDLTFNTGSKLRIGGAAVA
jgi:fibronectin-binding autotransporter adhesin